MYTSGNQVCGNYETPPEQEGTEETTEPQFNPEAAEKFWDNIDAYRWNKLTEFSITE